MPPRTLSAAEKELLSILRTTHTHATVHMKKCVELIYRQEPAERMQLAMDLLMWLYTVPADSRRIDNTENNIVENRTAVDLLNAMLEKGQISQSTQLDLGTTLVQAGLVLMQHLDLLAEHGSVVQAVWLSNICLLNPDVPFLKHIPPPTLQTVEAYATLAAITEHPDVMAELEHLLRQDTIMMHQLAYWLQQLPARTGSPELAVLFTQYTLARFSQIAEQNFEPPDAEEEENVIEVDLEETIDPKKAN